MLTGEINITDNLERAKKKICDSRPIAVGVYWYTCISYYLINASRVHVIVHG